MTTALAENSVEHHTAKHAPRLRPRAHADEETREVDTRACAHARDDAQGDDRFPLLPNVVFRAVVHPRTA